MPEDTQELKDYVERHLESGIPKYGYNERGTSLYGKLEIPLGKVKYDDEGNVALERDGISLSYSYGPVTPESTTPDIYQAITDAGIHRWRQLNKLTLANTRNNTSLEITALVPNGVSTVFKTDDPHFDEQSTSNPEDKLITLRRPLTELATVITFLHEIGHMVDPKTDQDLSPKEWNKVFIDFESHWEPVKTEHQAAILRAERNAWAYAFKMLRPLLKGQDDNQTFSSKRVLDYMHYKLESYSDIIKEKRELEEKKT